MPSNGNLPTSAGDPANDRLRTYENCSYSDVLAGKRISFSAPFTRAALAKCTIDWIDPSFELDFVLGKTSPKLPVGRKSPRASVSRSWKPAAAVVEAAAGMVEAAALERNEGSKKTGSKKVTGDLVAEDTQSETDVSVPPVSSMEEEEEEDDDDDVEVESAVGIMEEIALPPKSATNNQDKSPSPTTSAPITDHLPVKLFTSATLDPVFLDWLFGSASTALTVNQERNFHYVKNHPQFLRWWQDELRAKH
ncbi:unnamed protein product [Zymoseptoria tritici ST99CH_1E4]|uniref:Uncharacterized protein n=1 Tax=Zymoseptoria tritici ST99CH_1E4 TaxID=1276532 RepID=A0A2H1H913_ZYMTR|nr:unnamed protein product [Zymoseptoria tritici ST99CH_1E4]